MFRSKSPAGLLLAGLAAFAWYKYSKMSPEQKKDLVNNLKEKGKKWFGQVMPENKSATASNGYSYGESTQYAG